MSKTVQKSIEINAKVKTSLEGLDKTIKQLEEGLASQKLNLGKNSGLSKLIKDYKDSKEQLDELLSGDSIARTDIKKAEQLGTRVSTLYKQIGKSFRELQNGNEEVFKKMFPSSFTAQITKSTQAINAFLSKLDTLGTKEARVGELRRELGVLNDELDSLKNRRIKIEVEADKKKAEQALAQIDSEMQKMRSSFKQKLFPEEVKDSKGKTQTEKLESSVQTWTQKLQRDKEAKKNLRVQELSKTQEKQIAKLQGQLTDSYGDDLIKSENDRLKALQAEQKKRAVIAKTPGAKDTARNRREYGGVTDKELSDQIAKSEKELQRLKNISKQIEDIKQQPQKAYETAVKKLDTQIKTDETNLRNAETKLADHKAKRKEEEIIAEQKTDDFMSGKQVAEATQQETEALRALNEERVRSLELYKKLKEEKTFESQEAKDTAINKKSISIDKKLTDITSLQNEINKLVEDTNINGFFDKLNEFDINTEGIERSREGLEGIKAELKNLDSQKVTQIRQALMNMGYSADNAEDLVDSLTAGIEKLGETDQDLKRAESEMANLKNQVLNFFSITNSIQLFKRAITSALDTVKELDATMTEAAVVTEFSVTDMWEKLPMYSKEAQKLGVSINGMYQATTLYYQQGLKTNEAMELGIETMKMAKIAAMDSTEATQAMTAALRGFNMELNETSAAQVNDVYSQLAAVTAADTAQIATAMSKTASIAAAANMEFETTAALLAQIIETTQEAPETAGTAMKTIIARFSEVKELRKQGETTGKDSEGEDIDVNKIQTALRTVGISMEGFFAGTEGLDSILLKLSQKWESLDVETQRYIATMAAGSRQQSRFIAMMSDYKRTTELVSEAQNSAGASQRQFEKTQDSLASSLTKLKNAWDQFLMGFANNDILKAGIDLLTFAIETINKLIDGISGGNGLVKSITSLIGIVGTLKMGKRIFESSDTLGIFGQIIGKTNKKEIVKQGEQAGDKAGTGFIAGLKRTIGKKGKIKAFSTIDTGEIDFDRYKKDLQKELDNHLANVGSDAISLPASFEGASNLEELNKSVDEYNTSLEKAGIENQKFQNTLNTEQYAKTATDFKSIGNAVMGAGAAVGLIATAFEAAGDPKFAEGIRAISFVIMGVGAAITYVLPIIDMVGKKLQAEGWKTQMAWIWLLGISAVIGVIAAAVTAFKSNTNEAKLEKMNKQLDNLSSAADEAKQKMEDMSSAKKGLDDLNKSFNNLTKGTREWRQALIENNQEVLELINTYPELSNFVSKGINGELIITEEGWNKAQQARQNDYATSLLAKTAMTQAIQEKELSMKIGPALAKTKILPQTQSYPKQETYVPTTTYIPGAAGGPRQNVRLAPAKSSAYKETVQLDQENFTKFLTIAAEKGVRSADEDLEKEVFEIINDLGIQVDVEIFSGQIRDMGKSFDELSLAALQVKQAEIARAEATAASIAQTSNKVTGSKKFGQAATDFSAQLYEDFDDKVKTRTNELTKKMDKGLQSTDAEDIISKYAEIKGIQAAEVRRQINEKEITRESVAAVVASQEIEGNWKKSMEGTVAILEKVESSKGAQAANELKGLLTDRGAGLTLSQLQGLEGKNSDEIVQYLKDYGLTDLDAENMGHKDLAALAVVLEKNVETASEAFGEATEQLEALGFENTVLPQGIATNIAQQFADKLNVLNAKGMADTFLGAYTDITSKLSPEQLDIFSSYLVDMDWTSVEQIEEFQKQLKDMGINIPEDKMKHFTQLLKEAGNATQNLDFEKVVEQIRGAEKIISEILSDSENRRFSEEQYKIITSVDSGLEQDFIKDLDDNWVYVGTEMEQLILALKDNTEALLGKSKTQLETKVKTAEVLNQNVSMGYYTDDGYVETTNKPLVDFIRENLDFSDVTDEADLAENLELLRAKLIEQNITPSSLGIEGFAEGVDFAGLSKESLTRIGTQLVDMAAQQQVYENQLRTADEQTGFSKYNARVHSLTNYEQGVVSEDEANALKLQAIALGITGSAYKEFVEAMQGVDEQQKKNTAATLANIIEQKKQAKIYGDILKKLEEVDKEYGDMTENMNGYSGAIIAYGEALGLDMSALNNYELIADNMDLIYQAAEGNIDAILEVNRLLAEEHGFTITAEGNFDDYNFAVGEAEQKTLDFIKAQLDAGAYKIVEVEVGSGFRYFKPIYDNGVLVGVEEALTDTSQTIQMIQPKNAGEIAQAKASGGSRRKSGGGGGANWENPYDKFYNTYERINTLLREREKIERRYEALLNREEATGRKLIDNAKQQLALLNQRESKQAYLKKGKLQEIRDLRASNSKYDKYVTDYDEETGTISIDWDAINKIKNTDTGEAVEKYISKLEELRDQYRESQDAIDEIKDTVEEIQERGKDEYFDIEERIKEALIKERQDEIDMLSAINDSINDTNSKLLDSMQEQLDEYRQNRDNEKTEKELSDKQRKLAYLQQDTTGANALEILKLQKELDEATEDYTDTLIDKKISELQHQNDIAAEQRQIQIDIMQAQLEHYEQSGKVWEDVYELWQNGVDDQGVLINNGRLIEILKQFEEFQGLSNLGKMEWLDDIKTVIAQAYSYLEVGRQLENIGVAAGTQINFKTKEGKELTGTVDDKGNVLASDGKTYNNVYQGMDGDYYAGENIAEASKPKEEGGQDKPNTGNGGSTKPKYKTQYYVNYTDVMGKNKETARYSNEEEAIQVARNEILKSRDAARRDPNYTKDKGGGLEAKTFELINKLKATAVQVPVYKTGGLANFTGPAWLDGTKSKPEYVLNAEQTKSFFTLVDVLSSLKSGFTQNTQNNGDNTYDIDINVESIGSDYDVEQLATTVKRLINEDARYRNNNAINLMR